MLTWKYLKVTICSVKSDSCMGPTRDNPVLENLGPPLIGPVLQNMGPPWRSILGTPLLKGACKPMPAQAFFLAVSKKLKPEKTQGFQKKLKQISQKLKDWPTLNT